MNEPYKTPKLLRPVKYFQGRIFTPAAVQAPKKKV